MLLNQSLPPQFAGFNATAKSQHGLAMPSDVAERRVGLAELTQKGHMFEPRILFKIPKTQLAEDRAGI